MPDPDPTSPDVRVAEVLEQVRAGVRQRRSEATTVGAGTEEARHRLLALKTREYVAEPVPFSHRPGLGRLVVVARKAAFHLVLKWLVRPVLEQQNGFNQAAARLIEELVAGQERLERRVADLADRLAELEARAGGAGRGAQDREG